MKLAILSLIPILPWLRVLSSQIPVVDGVIGGVPGPDFDLSQFLEVPKIANVVTTPGKLRVVENSGICGQYIFSMPNIN